MNAEYVLKLQRREILTMKKRNSILKGVSLIMVLCMTVVSTNIDSKSVKADDNKKLPFTLSAPSFTAMTKTEGDSPTTMEFTYSMSNEMVEWLGLEADEMAKTIADLGYEDIYVNSQIDWAVDDPTDWHHTEIWDTDGYDKDYNYCAGCWDAFGNLVYATTLQESWIMRVVSFEDPENVDWNGNEYIIGLKNQLKSGQYYIEDNMLHIDYTKHTVYARARYKVTVRDSEKDSYVFSDWSPVASYGKDSKYVPVNKEDLGTPKTSNLRNTDEEFNGNPVLAYDLEVNDLLTANLIKVGVTGGIIWIEAQARIQGTEEWITLQGDFEIKSGEMKTTLIHLANSKYAVEGENKIDVRWRYYCSQYDNSNQFVGEIYSDYSPIQSITAVLHVPKNEKNTSDNGGNDEQGNNNEAAKDAGPGNDGDMVGKYITEKVKNDNDVVGSTFGHIKARSVKVKNNSVKVQWDSTKNAKKYVVYGNRCGKINSYNYLTETTKKSVTYKTIHGVAVNKNSYYKFIVVALDANNKVIATSKTIHVATSGGKYTNPKSVAVTKKAAKGKVTLKSGKSIALKAKPVKANKKLKWQNHRGIKYESSDKNIAVVNDKGKITAKKKGKCIVYAYAQNGVFKKIAVTVK